ncbi:outer membrane protein assembly factor BamC [Alkalimarinus coralli]|uniref:outer membrane protein assembly factor BamC n=1 Tax=Alkalimarinus coralli TaxID=2935863 RepID=UPI00202B7414|nr:outer membrane protein assembly factor BamC [Alkalimarinus coralli]
MSLIRFLVVTILVLSIAACGVVRDRSNDYVDAERGQAIVVPDWYRSDDIRPRYPIPPIENRDSLPEEYVLPSPPDATITILTENYVIETLDEQSWLLVNETPGRIWPSLDQFWEENGVRVEFENPRLGLMQTEVLGSSLLSKQLLSRIGLGGSTVDRPLLLQAKLGQGVKRNTTELQVRVLDTKKKGPQEFKTWSGLPGRRLAEEKLLQIISSYLENNQSYRSYSLLATDIGGASKVALVSGNNERPYLKLDLSFERAWGAATKGLRGAKIKVADRDRSKGIFYLDYGREEEEGWFSSLFSSGDEQRPEYNYTLDLEKIEDGYRLIVNKTEGEPITRLEEMEILNLLLDNIS